MAWINEANWPEAWTYISFSPIVESGGQYIVYAGGYNIQKFYSYNLDTDVWTELAAPPDAIYGAISMSPDGTKLAAHAANGKVLFIYDIAGDSWSSSSAAPNLSVTGEVAQIQTIVWADDDTIWCHVRDALEHGRNKCYKYVTDTWTQYTNVYTLGPYNNSKNMSVNSAGTALFVGSVHSGAARYYGFKYVIAIDTYSQFSIGSGWDFNINSDRSARLWHIDALTSYAGTRYYDCDTETVSAIIFPNDSERNLGSQNLACGIYGVTYIIAHYRTSEPKNRSYRIITAPSVTTNPASAIGPDTGTPNGKLDNDGGEACDCGFEWGETIGYGRIEREADWATGVLSDVEAIEDELMLATIASDEVEDTYNTSSLTGSPYTVIYNRMEFKSAGTLTKVKVKTKTTGNYILRIKSDDGVTTYQTHTIEGAAADSWITFEIDDLAVISGGKYRMEVTRPSGTVYAAAVLYNGTYWKNNKTAFGGSEFDYTNAMGFVLLIYEYVTAGYRVAPPLDLSIVIDVNTSIVEWTQSKPANTDIEVKFAINEDPTTEPASGEYVAAVNGDPIPGITPGDNLTGKWLWARQELSTTDDTVTPKLQTLREYILGNITSTQSRTTGQTFSQAISGLDPGKTYHFRAFATNAAGTSYGSDQTFTTLSAIVGGINPSLMELM